MRPLLALAFSAIALNPAVAQRDPTNTLPLATTRTVKFTTDEGTWMSVDVSPDGSTIVFDLLGDLYTIPMAGGKATRIVGGNSVDMQPRFSPDGKSIVFTSDRSGVDATWIVDADGKHPRLLTPGGSMPAWTPDGKHIVTGNRLVDVRGGAGIQLQQFGTGASFTADGRYIWFQQGTQAARYDRRSGSVGYQTNLPGGVLRPLVSGDGKSLVYFTRFESKAALVVRNLETGADKWVLMGTQPEAYGAPASGALPGSAWLPDNSGIVTSFGGKIWRVAIASGAATAIPFSADVEQSLGALARGSQKITDSVTLREIQTPAISPDGRRVAFTGLGKVWVMDLVANATPKRLTSSSNVVESSPAWTPDGRSIVFATWVDNDGGDILKVDANGGAPTNLTRAPAMYTRMTFTRDGSRLVFARAPRRARTVAVDDGAVQPRTQAGSGTELNFELRWMPANGGTQTPIAMVADVGLMPLGGQAQFTSDTSRVFFHDGTALVSTRWDGTDRRVVVAGATPQTLLSPDGTHVLSRAGRRRYIYMYERPLVADSITIDPSASQPTVPIRRLTRVGADFPSWSLDGSKAVWSSGTTLYVYDVAQGDKATADSTAAAIARIGVTDTTRRGGGAPADSAAGGGGAGRWAPAYEAARFEVKVAVAADKPSGSMVLRGARIITMKGTEVIENGDIVITDNRIVAVGAKGKVQVPSGARVVDVAGKTIVPGFVDVHAQLGSPAQVHRTVMAQYLANLAFGITTARDPESQATDVFTYADRVATGELVGPRVFATGPVVLDSLLTLRTAAEARDFVTPYATAYHSGSIRGDLLGTRPDRQRFLTVSKDLGLSALAMGAPDYRKSLTAALDGYAEQHAAYEVYPLHGDFAKLLAESGLTYAPMLLGRVGPRNGMEYILGTEKPHEDPRVRRFYYHKDLDRLARPRGTWYTADEYPFDAIASSAARIVAAGGKVAIGSNGRVQGLGFHYDMWLMAKGGMPNHDVLRAATIFGAEAIGVGTEIGSIEAGKLADLQVLDRNPLTDIRNTSALKYVMKNGRLYDANTLDQVGPTPTKLANLWWLELDPTGGSR